MFSVLKKFFKKEENEKISVHDLPEWFDKKTHAFLSEATVTLDTINNDIKQEIKKTREQAKVLEHATLKNENIPERAKHFMEGNRRNYLQRIDYFLDHIKLPTSISNASTKEFEEDLQETIKATAKSFKILQEFFAHESRHVAAGIHAIEKHMKRIETLTSQYDLEGIKETENLISQVKGHKSRKSERAKKLNENKLKIDELQKKGEELSAKKGYLEQGKEMRAYKELTDEIQTTEETIRKKKAFVTELFAPVEKPLRKYAKIAMDSAYVTAYSEHAPDALLSDKEFKILGILEGLKNNLESLELKERAVKKVLEAVAIINKDLLNTLQKDIIKEQEKRDLAVKKREKITIIKEQEKLEQELEGVKGEIQKLREQNTVLEEQKKTDAIEELLQKTKDNIEKVFHVKVEW